MRFNIACLFLGLFTAASAIPVAVQSDNNGAAVEARAPSSTDSGYDLRELGGAVGVNVYHARGTQIFNSRGEEIDARETFGLTSADLESRDAFVAALSDLSRRAKNKVTIQVTFTGDLSSESNNPTRAKTQSTAKAAVQSLLNAAAKSLDLEGKTIDVVFLNDFHESRGETISHVTFEFEETVCEGTCTGHAFGGSKGDIFNHNHEKIYSKRSSKGKGKIESQGKETRQTTRVFERTRDAVFTALAGTASTHSINSGQTAFRRRTSQVIEED
ncbi:hypothetical protein EV359DRAFT_64360 [Lentinula novae-zelandiae]|nr:hypothetical protein EV359DRAFT_64360 [Lentinula novae-zelandiae]